jgi:hypothetical protein
LQKLFLPAYFRSSDLIPVGSETLSYRNEPVEVEQREHVADLINLTDSNINSRKLSGAAVADMGPFIARKLLILFIELQRIITNLSGRREGVEQAAAIGEQAFLSRYVLFVLHYNGIYY